VRFEALHLRVSQRPARERVLHHHEIGAAPGLPEPAPQLRDLRDVQSVKSVTYTVEERRRRAASAVTISCFCALVRIMRTPPDSTGRPAPSCWTP